MSPQIRSQKMVDVKTFLPPQFLEQVQEVADEDGWKESDFIRMCIVMGFHAYCTGSNSVLMNKQTRSRLRQMEGLSSNED